MSPRRRRRGEEEDDDGMVLPIDPSQILGMMGGKEDDLRVEGNKVYFHKPVTRSNILKLIQTLHNLSKKLVNQEQMYTHTGDNTKIPIILFINSEGGDLFSGLSGLEHIRNLPVEVHTVIDGFAASAATLLSIVGTKRYIMKHSFCLIHQMRSGMMGTYEEMKDEMKNNENIMKIMRDIYSRFTDISKKKLDSFMSKDIYIDSTEAIKLGVADAIWDPYGKNKDLDEPPKKRTRISKKKQPIVVE